uniref:Uncharacterized protein n=2 Tax=Sphaerodactylus townsendi TaxID=933632 RepID=A0ACB8FTW8_9SAUR
MGKEQLTLKNLEVAIQELYPENPYAPSAETTLTGTTQNWEQPQKPKNRLYEKASRIENGLEAIVAKNFMEPLSPKLINKHKVKAQTKARQEEKVRSKKKWSRDSWNGEQGAKPSRRARETERYFDHERYPESTAEESLDMIVRCEKCQRERQLRQRLQKERSADLPFDNRDMNMKVCQRYHVDKTVKLRSCRRLSENSAEECETLWSDAGCLSTWTASQNHGPEELPKPKRGVERQQTLQSHENHDKELGKVKMRPIENQHTIVGDGYELKKEHRKCSRVNQSCWLLKGSEVDADKLPKTQGKREEVRKSKEETVGGEEKAGHGEGEQARHEREGEVKGKDEENGTSNKSLKHNVQSRSDVEKCYEIGKTIGDGNFAVVMECHHRSSSQNYAMKIVDKSKLKGKEDMLENEIVIIRSLTHPNIVSLIEVFETEAEIYLILEYIPGGDLFDAIIQSVKFTERDAALMMTDLCGALVYIHGKNIVHRDLKPENLLVQRNPDKTTTLKLADFGLAKLVTKPIFTVCGTPTYVAPEILAENGYGLEVDMWATGVILYILLCGFPPFRSHERDQEELFQIIQLGHYEYLSPYWDNISAAAKDLISRLLVVDPQKRYTAQQVLQHLWIQTAGKNSSRNLQREVTLNLERHFRSQRKKDVNSEDS